MLTPSAKEELEKQHYRIIGEHSAVKVCGWTKNMINGQGGCYKLKFYGIMSHQCMQMTTSISCANRCTFCWRGYKAPVSKTWKWDIDDPKFIADGAIDAHHKLLIGYKGSPKAIPEVYKQSNEIKHVALSLTGEPITYPRMNEIIKNFHSRGISTFLVTNSQYVEELRNLKQVTQLYLSIDAPNKKLLKEVDKPLFTDYYERMLACLDILAKKKERTCIRMTCIKSVNMVEPENYAKLIEKGNPDFIEIKGYMHVGPSTQRLSIKNMPIHEEVLTFSKLVADCLPNYEIVSEHIPSRVIMLAHKKYFYNGVWNTWINFKKFHEICQNEFVSSEYNLETPLVGLSGKGTFDNMSEKRKMELLKEDPSLSVYVDEVTPEEKLNQ